MMITVDTEALPKRAEKDHVKRLMWGEFDNGVAGVREMCSIINEFQAKMVFFVDSCASFENKEEVREVIRWLDNDGQDVQLHTHSEYLPESFWLERGMEYQPRMLNRCEFPKTELAIGYFSEELSMVTGKPVRAYRAGSFRWNADTIRVLKELGIPLSFNNSMSAYLDGHCTFSSAFNDPYKWSNGVIEIPITEKRFFPMWGKQWWGHFRFPAYNSFPNPYWTVARPFVKHAPGFLVMLLHSWSLLHWDREGRAEYRGDRRIEDLRKIVKRLTKDYDIITTGDFLELCEAGVIKPTREIDLSVAELPQKRAVKK